MGSDAEVRAREQALKGDEPPVAVGPAARPQREPGAGARAREEPERPGREGGGVLRDVPFERCEAAK